jgi:hypothetical protein
MLPFVACMVGGCGGILSAFGEDPAPQPESGSSSDGGPSGDVTTVDGESVVDADVVGDAKTDAGVSLRAFVTLDTYAGDALASPDSICAQAAASLDGGTWRAWISHPLRQAANVIGGNGPWRRLDGVVVAQDRAQLLGGNLAATLNRDQKGNPRDAFVWTGTSASGSSLSSHCDQWTKTSGYQGTYGQSALSNNGWTAAGEATCVNNFAVYCFEVP